MTASVMKSSQTNATRGSRHCTQDREPARPGHQRSLTAWGPWSGRQQPCLRPVSSYSKGRPPPQAAPRPSGQRVGVPGLEQGAAFTGFRGLLRVLGLTTLPSVGSWDLGTGRAGRPCHRPGDSGDVRGDRHRRPAASPAPSQELTAQHRPWTGATLPVALGAAAPPSELLNPGCCPGLPLALWARTSQWTSSRAGERA